MTLAPLAGSRETLRSVSGFAAFGSAPLREPFASLTSGVGKGTEAEPAPAKVPFEFGESPSSGKASVSGESESRTSRPPTPEASVSEYLPTPGL